MNLQNNFIAYKEIKKEKRIFDLQQGTTLYI